MEALTSDSNTMSEFEEQSRRDALLVYMLFSTSLTEQIVSLCKDRDKLSYNKATNKTEMGYVAHLTRLAQLLVQIGEKNELIGEQLEEDTEWKSFESGYLQPRIEVRTGNLCRQNQFEKQKESRFKSMFDDDEDDGDTPANMFHRKDDYGGNLDDQRTNQDEMDQLMKPCLDFDDDDEEEESGSRPIMKGLKPKLDSNGEKESLDQNYNISNYNSNGDVDRGHKQSAAHSSQTVFSKRNGKAGVVKRYNSEEDEDEDEGDTYGRKNNKDNFMDDDENDEFERDGDPLSLDELEGWMNEINLQSKSQEKA